jgi:hypothetical protein
MKRFLFVAIAILSCATILSAGSLDKVVAKISAASLTHVKSQANTTKIKGWLERIDCTFANATSSVALVVLASNELTGITTTLLDIGAISNATSYYPRNPVQTTDGTVYTTNGVARFMVLDETIYLTATNATYSNQTVQAVIFYERP